MTENKKPTCPACHSTHTRRNGTDKTSGSQKMYCCDCGKHFRKRYKYQGRKHNIERRIDQLSDLGLSVRKIATKLRISPTTVQTHRSRLREQYQARISESYKIEPADLHLISWSGGRLM